MKVLQPARNPETCFTIYLVLIRTSLLHKQLGHGHVSDKVTFVYCNIKLLFELVHSSDFFPYLQFSMFIFTAPGESYTVMLSEGLNSWMFLLESASTVYLGWQVF